MAIKFTDIDVRRPLQPIYVDDRYDRLFVLVRWGYRPLTQLQFACKGNVRTVDVDQLRSRIMDTCSWQLWEHGIAGTLEALNGERAPDGEWPPISVVVCTRDRPFSLERCLEALAQVDYPSYEVVVVDNASRGGPEIHDIVARRGFRYVREETPGLDWARNRGFREARHDIIAYIDDDAQAGPGWLRGLAYGFQDPEIMAVTGAVLAAEIETKAQDDFERYGGMCKGLSSYVVRRSRLSNRALFWASNWGVGTNMAFRRSLFEAIGGFDVALDAGTPAGGAGDIEFFYRLLSAGYVLRYEAAALVRHVHRRDDAGLQQQIYNNGRSFVAYLLTVARNQPHRRMALFRFALRWWLWEWLFRRLLTGVIKRDRWTYSFALAELRGALSGPGAYRKAQRVARSLAAERT
jgi:glycosyltransferase involved in cell wall biosynthesis